MTNNIEIVLKEILGNNVPLIVTSKHDSDCGEKVATLLGNFSPDELLLQKLGNKVITLLRGIEMMCGGKMTIRPREGGGTTVIVTILIKI